MTPEPEERPLPRVSTDAELQRLLASARVREPMPPDVVARLDATLAELHAQTPGTAAAAGPLPRRWAPRLLGVAAVVVVLGGGALVVQAVQDSGTPGVTTADTSSHAEQAPRESGGDAGADSDGSAGAESQAGAERQLGGSALPEIRSANLREDVQTVLDTHPQLGGPGRPADLSDAGASSSAGAVCPGPSWLRGTSVPVRYDARLTALVLRPETPQGRRTAEIWTCDGDHRLARTTVPAAAR